MNSIRKCFEFESSQIQIPCAAFSVCFIYIDNNPHDETAFVLNVI